jgi:acetolactate synthase I/II/III large subunit
MNGAESLVHTLLRSGVDTCFCNPGTSEMHFVAALDRVPGMRCVLGLFEGVVTGAADGYARMSGKPAATLLHCGPGLANGLANLHNARRAQSPIVNVVGDQATYHRPNDAPLTADTEGWARRLRLGAHCHLLGHRWRRCGGCGAGRSHPSGPDRHADPALRHLMGRRRHRR